MKTASRYKRHFKRNSEARTIRKAVSAEPLLDFSSDDEEDRTGGKDSSNGARLTCGSLTPSPAGKRLFMNKSASEAAGSRPGSTDSFQVGANTDDDVFAKNGESAAAFQGTASLDGRDSVDAGGHLAEENVDAQVLYPPTACIFVANLAQMYDDKTLECEVTRTFSRFGNVFVKIRRDSRQMPFAFCQFTNDEHARNAERLGKGLIILSRPCRTEMARAHVSFIVYKHSGDLIDTEETIDLLSALGEVAKTEKLDVDTQHSMKLPPAVVASYKMYDPKRDVPLFFRGNRQYKVIPYDPKSSSNQRANAQVSPSREQFLHQYDRDRRSIYMGNLPMDMTEETLANLAQACGDVNVVNLFKKPVAGNPGKMTCFAFVEFARPDSADDAILAFNAEDINGFTVRVDRKQPRGPHDTPRRTMSLRGANYAQTFPRRRHAPEPVSPLHTIFDPPAGRKPPVMADTTEMESSNAMDQTPKAADESVQNLATESKAYAGTPQKASDSHNVVYSNMDTPVAMAPQHTPIPMPWIPHPYPYAYGPPMSPYGPMTPHGTPGVMYPGYSPGYYPGMYPEMYPMASPPHMMHPPHTQHMQHPAPAEVPMEQHAPVAMDTDKEPK